MFSVKENNKAWGSHFGEIPSGIFLAAKDELILVGFFIFKYSRMTSLLNDSQIFSFLIV